MKKAKYVIFIALTAFASINAIAINKNPDYKTNITTAKIKNINASGEILYRVHLDPLLLQQMKDVALRSGYTEAVTLGRAQKNFFRRSDYCSDCESLWHRLYPTS